MREQPGAVEPDAVVVPLDVRCVVAVEKRFGVLGAEGVSRQTVYAHYPGRKALIAAVVNRITEQAEAAMDAARLDEGPAAAAVVRVLEVSWRLFKDYPLLLQEASDALSPAELSEVHGPVFGRLERLVRRGQEAGEVDPQAPPRWLVAVFKGAATAATGRPGPLQDFYHGMIARGMDEELARVTLTRKLVAVTLRLWKKGERYDPTKLTVQAR